MGPIPEFATPADLQKRRVRQLPLPKKIQGALTSDAYTSSYVGWMQIGGNRVFGVNSQLLGNDLYEDAVGQLRIAKQVDNAIAGEATQHGRGRRGMLRIGRCASFALRLLRTPGCGLQFAPHP